MLRDQNPEDGVNCYFCNGDGCFCQPTSHRLRRQGAIEVEDCVSCDICEGTGLISKRLVEEMVRHYRAEDQFKQAWKSAI